jgi:hypothetical protein
MITQFEEGDFALLEKFLFHANDCFLLYYFGSLSSCMISDKIVDRFRDKMWLLEKHS